MLEAFPPHPLSDLLGNAAPFDAARHKAFQSIMLAHGSAAALAEKRGVLAALKALQEEGAVTTEVVAQAIAKYGIKADKINPLHA